MLRINTSAISTSFGRCIRSSWPNEDGAELVKERPEDGQSLDMPEASSSKTSCVQVVVATSAGCSQLSGDLGNTAPSGARALTASVGTAESK